MSDQDSIEKALAEFLNANGGPEWVSAQMPILTALVRERIPAQLLDVLAFKDARITALEAALEKVRTNHLFKTHIDEDNCMSCDNLYDEVAALLAKTRKP